MSRFGLTFLLLMGFLPLAACMTNEEAAQRRCGQAGIAPGTPQFQDCVQEELRWREQNKAIQNKVYTSDAGSSAGVAEVAHLPSSAAEWQG